MNIETPTFPLFSSRSATVLLRVASPLRALFRLESGGAAAWRRDGQVASDVQSRIRSLGLMLVFGLLPVTGVMPLDWSGASDLVDRVWGLVGLFFLALLLLRLEHRVGKWAAASFNKVEATATLFLPAGRGGEGRRWSTAMAFQASFRCLRAALEEGKFLWLVGVHGDRNLVSNLARAFQISSLVSSGHLERWICGAATLLPAGHGGEGWRRSSASSSSSLGWRGWFVLHLGVNYAVAVFAAAIFDRSGGPSCRHVGDSSTSSSEAFFGASSRSSASSRRQVVHPRRRLGGRLWWFVLGGVDCGPDRVFIRCTRVRRVKVQDSCVFSTFLKGPVCNLYPPTGF